MTIPGETGKSPISKRMVIDADIARTVSAHGKGAAVPCQHFLEQVLNICHRVVMTPDGMREWNEHASRLSREWLVIMAGKAGKLVKLSEKDVASHKTVLQLATEKIPHSTQRREMKKDLHLLEGALSSDYIIVTMDKKARKRMDQYLTDEIPDMGIRLPQAKTT